MGSAFQRYNTGMVDIAASAWVDYPGKQVEFPRIEGTVTADIAVVGAGLAGVSLALHLAEGGARVVVLEAKEPGWGASGRNAGQINAHHDLAKAAAALPDGGEGFLDLFKQSATLPYELVEKHDIDCDARRDGFLYLAPRRGFDGMAQKQVEAWNKLGFPARYVDSAEVAEMTGTDRFYSAVFDPQSGSINPYYYTRGLADAARQAGAVVFSQSPVNQLKRDDGRWKVSCETGQVEAENVVLCTGAYDRTAWPGLTRAWYPQVAYTLATKVLPEPLRSTFMPFGGASQQLPGGHTVALDRFGRLYTGLLPSFRPHRMREPIAYLERWLHRFYPQSRNIKLEYAGYWTGALAWSNDQLPRIYDLAPGLLALNCFSSVGNVPAPMMGKHLAEKLLSSKLDELVLPLQSPEPASWRSRYEVMLRWLLVPLSRTAERMRVF